MVKITSAEELVDWLEDKPLDWAQIIAMRAALRSLPNAFQEIEGTELNNSTIAIFRCAIISWVACTHNPSKFVDSSFFAIDSTNNEFTPSSLILVNTSISAIAYSAGADGHELAISAIKSAVAETYVPSTKPHSAISNVFRSRQIEESVWQSIEADALYLERYGSRYSNNLFLNEPLWSTTNIPIENNTMWDKVKLKLLTADSNFTHLIEWYKLRLIGENSGFNIPHDIGRKEDRVILIKLVNATDEDFWDKGAEYVNAQLGEWLHEARERAQERYNQEQRDKEAATDFIDETNIPPQEASVTSFTAGEDGKIDRAPATQENRLRDVPDARQSYADLRKKVEKLRQEGQRLGSSLQEALDELLNSLPEDFEQALAYNVWRDGTNLREIYELHEIALQSPDYDPDTLENAIARKLKGVLSLFNNFAFDDDGLRQRDERIPPQIEIQNAAQEAQKAQPIIISGKTNSEIYTQPVLDELDKLPERQNTPENVYEQQKLVEENKLKRNLFAALMSSAKYIIKHIRKSASDMKTGAGTAVGGLAVTDIAGLTEASKSILKFIADNAGSLKEYVTAAYSNPALQKLIDAVVDVVNAGIF